MCGGGFQHANHSLCQFRRCGKHYRDKLITSRAIPKALRYKQLSPPAYISIVLQKFCLGQTPSSDSWCKLRDASRFCRRCSYAMLTLGTIITVTQQRPREVFPDNTLIKSSIKSRSQPITKTSLKGALHFGTACSMQHAARSPRKKACPIDIIRCLLTLNPACPIAIEELTVRDDGKRLTNLRRGCKRLERTPKCRPVLFLAHSDPEKGRQVVSGSSRPNGDPCGAGKPDHLCGHGFVVGVDPKPRKEVLENGVGAMRRCILMNRCLEGKMYTVRDSL